METQIIDTKREHYVKSEITGKYELYSTEDIKMVVPAKDYQTTDERIKELEDKIQLLLNNI